MPFQTAQGTPDPSQNDIDNSTQSQSGEMSLPFGDPRGYQPNPPPKTYL